jgi:hypothetical protein
MLKKKFPASIKSYSVLQLENFNQKCSWKKIFFLFDTVGIWEFFPVWTDFDKCHNLSKRNVKLILRILSDLEPLRGPSNKKKRCIQLVRVQIGPFLALVGL